MRDIDAFYVIKHENGDDFSVMFTNEEFKKFIPSSILSTQLLSWTAGINIEYKKAVRKLKSNKVSYKERIYVHYHNIKRPTDEFKTMYRPLNLYERESCEKTIELLKHKLEPLTLYKIV
jgi:hypothetical protein